MPAGLETEAARLDAHEVDFDEAVARSKMYVKEEQIAAECQRAAHREEAA